ncbi:hypothetical protein MBCUT_09830 [Methanobrevibacter cuticularis]|uniref:Uncharacterized protein n=1 Tax=Methanobrevibacter cuticularis TaxID=47311 RepID=A0A166CRC8_9EURY|nr:UPF0280 family protein [Methanobrevibacter cuticularis]KZX16247.1 hypothetical protein MBCUT_09830 [Methanobrevibacter cuticularis]
MKSNLTNSVFHEKIVIDETNINLVSDIEKNDLNSFITKTRLELKDYILKTPEFARTLKPYNPNKKVESKVVKLMIEASNIANVGPTAAIAGTISELSLEYLIKQGSSYSIVDNGGDIAFINKNKRVICGIYAGNSPLSGKIAFEFKNQENPIGICSSSGSVGYSTSYGRSDCVTIISKKASISDALATSIANHVNGKSDEDAVENGLNASEEFKDHFIGALIILGESIGTIGKLPKIVEVNESSILNNIDDG